MLLGKCPHGLAGLDHEALWFLFLFLVLALLIGFAAVSGLAWFFAVLILLGLSAASGPAHRIDLPFFATIVAFGLILVVAVVRDLVGWSRRRSDRDVD